MNDHLGEKVFQIQFENGALKCVIIGS